MTMSPEYQAALDAADVAFQKFEPIRRAYHEGKLSDDVFLAAAAEYRAAQAAFDVAFDAEQARAEEAAYDAGDVAAAPDADQIDLFR